MKLLKYSLFSLLFILSFSCEDEPVDDTGVVVVTDPDTDTDDNDDDDDDPNLINFFPSTLDSEWNYDVINTNNDTNETTNSTDRLYIESENLNTFTFGVNEDNVANGTMNRFILEENTMNKTETNLSTTGELVIPIPELDIVIPFDNLILYNLNAPNSSMLSSFTGTIESTFENFPITTTYTLSTTQAGQLNTINLNGEDYNNVVKSNLSLVVSVIATVEVIPGLPVELPILDTQDFLSIDYYIAKEIGLVRSEANTTFMINAETLMALEQAGVDISNFPSSSSVTNIQELTSFTIQ